MGPFFGLSALPVLISTYLGHADVCLFTYTRGAGTNEHVSGLTRPKSLVKRQTSLERILFRISEKEFASNPMAEREITAVLLFPADQG